MGVFEVQVQLGSADRDAPVIALPNHLADEVFALVYHRIFPPLGAALTDLRFSLTGCSAGFPTARPNPGAGASLGTGMTYAALDNPACEAGAYTLEMQQSLGYTRQPATMSVTRVAGGATATSQWVQWSNPHAWTPQDGEDWDLPWTNDQVNNPVEQPPPDWGNRWSHWIAPIGFPWFNPRKRCGTTLSPPGWTPPLEVPSYWHEWQPNGDLNWLCNFYMLQFPLTGIALLAEGNQKAIAATRFPDPEIIWWPDISIRARYKALFHAKEGNASRDFLYRWARRAFENAEPAYDAILVRPALATAPKPFPDMKWADYAGHFEPALGGGTPLAPWTFNTDHVEAPEKTWTNSSGGPLGPFGSFVLYGELGANDPEILWVAPFDPVTLEDGDRLVATNGFWFYLDRP